MARLDDDIDHLYQMPLGEFTAARGDLEKRAGDQRAKIKKLQKPNVAAWTVNQLYWHRRKSYDRLLSAAERLRSAHAQQLAGKKSDVAGTEAIHQAAVRAAAEDARAIAAQSGDAASLATMIAVIETLRALPSPDPPGRLTRPLKPLGFEALAHLLSRPGSGKRATVLPFAPPQKPAKPAERDRAAERREQAAARREAAALERRLREARQAERAAADDVAKARRALAQVEDKRTKLEQMLEQTAADVRRLREALSGSERNASHATSERNRLELALRSAESRHSK